MAEKFKETPNKNSLKSLFPGFYKYEKDEIQKIWENGILIFDANTILNLYRYSESTAQDVLSLIEKSKDRIYLPFQAAYEINLKRCDVISDLENKYNEFKLNISKIKDNIQNVKYPPYLSEKAVNDFNEIYNRIEEEIKQKSVSLEKMYKEDPIYEKVSKIFEGRILDKFTDERLEEIFKEGENRYEKKIPPGYEDAQKPSAKRKFGDLIIWNEILEASKKFDKDIIFISDDQKEDWLNKVKGNFIIGARPELTQEIFNYSGKKLLIYSTYKFLELGKIHLHTEIDEQSVNEIRKLSAKDLLSIVLEDKIFNKQKQEEIELSKLEALMLQRTATQYRLNELLKKEQIGYIESNSPMEILKRDSDRNEIKRLKKELIILDYRLQYINKTETTDFKSDDIGPSVDFLSNIV